MASVVLAACMAALPPRADAQPRLETRGDQSPAISAGRDAIVNHGYTPAQLQGLIDLVTRSSTEAAEARREVGDLRERLALTNGAALAILRTLGQADVPAERLPQALGDLAKRHHELLGQLQRPDGADPAVARLKDEARAAVERGEYDRAEALLRRVDDEDLAAARREQDATDRRWLRAAESRADLARLAGLRLRHAESARLYGEAADLTPESAWQTRIRYLTDAGVVLLIAGHTAGAEVLFRRALAVVDRHGGETHPLYAGLLTLLATPAVLRGQSAEVESLTRRALDLTQRQPDHPLTGMMLVQLASALQKTGRHTEAEPLAQRALDLAQRQPDSSIGALMLGQIAIVLGNAGRDTEAEALHRRALPVLRGVKDPQMRAFASMAQALFALVLARTGREQEAEALTREAVEMATAAYGPEHHLTNAIVFGLSGLLSDAGRDGEAEPLLRRALANFEAALEPDDKTILAARVELGVLLMRTGRAAEGEPMVRTALAAAERRLGAASYVIVELRAGYGETLAKIGREREAEPLLRETFTDAERLYGPRHPTTVRLRRVITGLPGQAAGGVGAATPGSGTPSARVGAPADGVEQQEGGAGRPLATPSASAGTPPPSAGPPPAAPASR